MLELFHPALVFILWLTWGAQLCHGRGGGRKLPPTWHGVVLQEGAVPLAAESGEGWQHLGGGDSNTLTPSACGAGEDLGLRMCGGTGLPQPPGCSAAPKIASTISKNPFAELRVRGWGTLGAQGDPSCFLTTWDGLCVVLTFPSSASRGNLRCTIDSLKHKHGKWCGQPDW